MVMEIFIDGGTHCHNICLYDPSHERYVVKHRRGEPTNNELEYLALIFALEYIRGMTYNIKDGITIYSDSQLIVNQINGRWEVNNDKLRELHGKCLEKMDKDIHVKWIPRRTNLAGIHLEALKDMSDEIAHTTSGRQKGL